MEEAVVTEEVRSVVVVDSSSSFSVAVGSGSAAVGSGSAAAGSVVESLEEVEVDSSSSFLAAADSAAD